jgi:hypothetical protein
MTEVKFGLFRCSKTLFAAQQLRGSVSAWWATFTATLPDGYQMSWTEFYKAFLGHHKPNGLMDRKQPEFLDLKQGSDTVYEYFKRFIYLAQYGSHHINTDVKKTILFHKGICGKIHEHLMPFQSWTFNQLMNFNKVLDLNFNKVLETRIAQLAAALPHPNGRDFPGQPVVPIKENVNAVIT